MRQYVWSSEALLYRIFILGYTPQLVGPSGCCWRTLNRKEQLLHRAVSLRQHSFLGIMLMPHSYMPDTAYKINESFTIMT